MASTSNKNTKSDYCLQQRQFNENFDYTKYDHSQYGSPYKPAFPDAGNAPPSRMWRDNLAQNPIEIESALLGIGSTNLVTPQAPVQPHLNCLPSMTFFERNSVIMPHNLVIENNQRPFPTSGR